MTRRAAAIATAAAAAAACGPANPPPAAPAARAGATPPTATTTCYAGLATGLGQTSRTVARRTLDPARAQIIEDVAHDAASAHGATSFHVVMTVDGSHFTLTEGSGAFAGSGDLDGAPWQWISWSSTSQIAHTNIVIESVDDVSDGVWRSQKKIEQDGKVVGTAQQELRPFDCKAWSEMTAALAVPPLDRDACTRACTNFATLKYWQTHPGDRDDPAAQAVLAKQIDSGAPACADQCMAAGNAVQTACMGSASTLDALAACDSQ